MGLQLRHWTVVSTIFNEPTGQNIPIPFFNEQMNQLMDKQIKNFKFTLANLWDRPRPSCLPILVKISHFSIFQWTNEPTDRHTSKKFTFCFSQSVRWVQGKISTNFGKDILKTERLFQLSFGLSDRLSQYVSEGVTYPICIASQLT